MRTRTLVPVSTRRTSTQVPKGSLRCAAVMALGSKRSPLAVFFPANFCPYHVAVPISSGRAPGSPALSASDASVGAPEDGDETFVVAGALKGRDAGAFAQLPTSAASAQRPKNDDTGRSIERCTSPEDSKFGPAARATVARATVARAAGPAHREAALERLHALFILALCLVKSLFAPLFGARRGLREFRVDYGPDRLPPVSPEERRVLPLLGGCIACGLCDIGEGVRAARSAGAYAGTMDLMLASSRSMPDYDAAAKSFAAVSDARLAELERRCPARVPMRKVAAFVRGKGSEIATP